MHDIRRKLLHKPNDKMTTDSLSFSTDVYQNGYKNLAISVKGTNY